MLLHARPIAVSTAVVAFFGLSFVSWISNLSPFICCKRALAGSVIVYITTSFAVKAINVILTNAMISSWMNQEKDKTGGGKD